MRLNWILILIFSCVQAEQNHNTLLFSKDSTQKIAEAEQSKINPKPDQLILIDFVGASEEDSVLLTRIFDNSEVYFELPESVEATILVKSMSYFLKSKFYDFRSGCKELSLVELNIEKLVDGEIFQLYAFYNTNELLQLEFDVTERESVTTITYSELENISPNGCSIISFKIDQENYNSDLTNIETWYLYSINESNIIDILIKEIRRVEIVNNQLNSSEIINHYRYDLTIEAEKNNWADLSFQYFFTQQDGVEYKGELQKFAMVDGKYQKVK